MSDPSATVRDPDPDSPCIKVCKLDATGQYCTGCYRTLEEIVDWLRYTPEQKRAVLQCLARRLPRT